MDKSDAESYFEKYREYLFGELGRLATYVRLYRRLHERKADRLEELNIAPAFFTTTIDALFSAIVLWVDKLFGERSERGLLNFLRFIEQHREILTLESCSAVRITQRVIGCCKIVNPLRSPAFKMTVEE